MPTIKMDWTFNIGHIASIVMVVIAMTTGWMSIKSDITTLDLKQTYVEKSISDIKYSQETNKLELKQDIKDLRLDVLQNEMRRASQAVLENSKKLSR